MISTVTNHTSIHWTDSEEYKKICDKIFLVMLSCKTIEHWESAKKFNDLAIEYCYEKRVTEKDMVNILTFGSFRRGFIVGMIQALNEERRNNAVKDYLSLGC